MASERRESIKPHGAGRNPHPRRALPNESDIRRSPFAAMG